MLNSLFPQIKACTLIGRRTFFTRHSIALAAHSKTRSGIILPKGWKEHQTGRGFYFYHEESGITQWEMPTGPPTKEQLAEAYQAKYGDQVSQLKPGVAVELKNLRTAPQFNGRKGTCERWDHSTGKIIIRLDSGELKAVRPECVFSRAALSKARPSYKQNPQNDDASAASAAPQAAKDGPSWKVLLSVGVCIYAGFQWCSRTGHVAYDPDNAVYSVSKKSPSHSKSSAEKLSQDEMTNRSNQLETKQEAPSQHATKLEKPIQSESKNEPSQLETEIDATSQIESKLEMPQHHESNSGSSRSENKSPSQHESALEIPRQLESKSGPSQLETKSEAPSQHESRRP